MSVSNTSNSTPTYDQIRILHGPNRAWPRWLTSWFPWDVCTVMEDIPAGWNAGYRLIFLIIEERYEEKETFVTMKLSLFQGAYFFWKGNKLKYYFNIEIFVAFSFYAFQGIIFSFEDYIIIGEWNWREIRKERNNFTFYSSGKFQNIIINKYGALHNLYNYCDKANNIRKRHSNK